MDFEAGLLALAVGLAFDMQRLFPAIGDRIAAVCALTVGGFWLSGGDIGGWFDDATTTATRAAGQTAHGVTTDVPVSGGRLVAGVAVGFVFLVWLLAMLPGLTLIQKHLSPKASNALSSGIIWTGVIFPPLVSLVPGNWGDLCTNITFAGVRLGQQISGWIL